MLFRVRRKFLLIAGVCLVVPLLIAFVAPTLLRRHFEDEDRTPSGELLKIDTAIRAYIAERGTTPPGLSSLRGQIASEFSCGKPTCDWRGYRFQYTVASQEASKPRYSLLAQPVEPGITGVRAYYLDQTGIMRCTREARAATSNDPPYPCDE